MVDCGCNHFPASGGNVTFDPGVLVGVGTASPASVLHVASAAPYPAIIMQGSDPASGVNGLMVQADGRTYTLFVGGSQNPGMPSAFGLYDSTAQAFRLAVLPNGNVGVGTTAPGAKLDVSSAGVGTQFQLENPNLAGNVWGLTPGDNGIGGQGCYLYRLRAGSTAGLGGGPAEALLYLFNDGTTRQTRFCSPNGTVLGSVDNTTGAAQFAATLTLSRTDVSSTYTKLLVDSNDLHLTSTATSDGTPTGTRGTISLQTNPFGDAIVQTGSAPGTGAFLVYQAGQQVLGVGRQQFGVYTVDANGVDYPYLSLDGNGLHLAATNPGFHGSTITLNTNVYGDAILSVGTGPGVGDLIVQQSGTQLMSVGGGGQLNLAGTKVADGGGCYYAS